MSVPALKTKLDELLVEYKTLQERNNILKKSYFNKGFENDSKTTQFFINTFGYTRDFENKDELHSSCIIDRILTADDVDTVASYKRNGVLRAGVKQFKEPCGLENKNVRDTGDTSRIGFVASDGTLQIYPDGSDVTKTTFDNCPTHEPTIYVDFNNFATNNELSEQNPCKITLENPLLVEMNRVYNNIKQTFEALKREMKNQPMTNSSSSISNASMRSKIDEFKEMNKEFKQTQSDIATLDGVESVADTMRIFSFYRIFLWAFLALLGFSLVYSIYKNGGKMSITSSIIIGTIICTVIYMNMYIIKKLFQNIY